MDYKLVITLAIMVVALVAGGIMIAESEEEEASAPSPSPVVVEPFTMELATPIPIATIYPHNR
jgi:hypothetical protein